MTPFPHLQLAALPFCLCFGPGGYITKVVVYILNARDLWTGEIAECYGWKMDVGLLLRGEMKRKEGYGEDYPSLSTKRRIRTELFGNKRNNHPVKLTVESRVTGDPVVSQSTKALPPRFYFCWSKYHSSLRKEVIKKTDQIDMTYSKW